MNTSELRAGEKNAYNRHNESQESRVEFFSLSSARCGDIRIVAAITVKHIKSPLGLIYRTLSASGEHQPSERFISPARRKKIFELR
jgi:hypothetical protein